MPRLSLHSAFCIVDSAFSHPRLLLALEFLLYAVLTAFALHATWLTWPDAYIDFSRELYLPWRVSQGDVLYRDLAYFFGPLSVYVNAALFSLLGDPSIHALFVLNFVFWVAIIFALRALLRRIAPPFATTLAVSSFILLFSFNRYTGIGNDNYLAPYSHEITRGFLSALLALLSLDSALTPAPSPRGLPAKGRMGETSKHPLALLLLSGFLLGLSLFSKPELALASTASLALLFVLHAWRRRSLLLLPFLTFSLAVLAAIVLVVSPFAIAFHSFFQALHDTLLKLYLDCFNPALNSLPYYKSLMGTDAFLSNLLRLIAGAALATVPLFLSRFVLPRLPSHPIWLLSIAFLALLSVAIGFLFFFPLNAAIPLAPVALAVLALRLSGRSSRFNFPLLLAFSAFSFFLVVKIALNCGIGHYGFVLAFPAFCCAILLPFCKNTENKHVPPRESFSPLLTSSKVVATALLLGFAGAALRLRTATLCRWDVTHPVHDDAFLSSPVDAQAFNAALDWIRSNTAPGSTLAVLPEGAVLNVLSGRPNPTPYISLEEPAVLRFDESSILAAYSNAPPDTLVLIQTAPPRFGIDYAQNLMAFLDTHYSPVFSISPPGSPAAPAPYLLVATLDSASEVPAP